ncbi:MAG: radical SAM protein [Clostridia bacterium]|nr:radical SAM protein [Clostridia bacterium]
MGKYKIIPIFVPHKGCPHQCSFCNQKHITGQVEDVTPELAEETVLKYLSTIDSTKNFVEIAFYGGSFTAIDFDLQCSLLEVAKKYKDKGLVHGIRLSTRPDAITDTILENLLNYGVTDIELGVQSMCEDVLIKNNRGHSANQVADAVSLIRKYPFNLGLQMMVGLIGDSKEKSIYTAHEIAKLKPDFVRIYPTLVFNNTPMAELYKSGEFVPLTVEQAVDICRDVKDIFDKNNIKIIRIGLLVTEDEAKENLLGGPYHPSFRNLL